MINARSKEDINNFLKNGNSLNEIDKFGNTLLHISVIKQNKLIEEILKNGADPNIKNFKGESPIFYCKNINDVSIFFKYHGTQLLNVFNNSNKNAVENKYVKEYLSKYLSKT